MRATTSPIPITCASESPQLPVLLTTGEQDTALPAEEAGAYLARRIGLDVPFTKHRMWQLARVGALPSLRVGRRVWFRTKALDSFVANGGTTREAR